MILAKPFSRGKHHFMPSSNLLLPSDGIHTSSKTMRYADTQNYLIALWTPEDRDCRLNTAQPHVSPSASTALPTCNPANLVQCTTTAKKGPTSPAIPNYSRNTRSTEITSSTVHCLVLKHGCSTLLRSSRPWQHAKSAASRLIPRHRRFKARPHAHHARVAEYYHSRLIAAQKKRKDATISQA